MAFPFLDSLFQLSKNNSTKPSFRNNYHFFNFNL